MVLRIENLSKSYPRPEGAVAALDGVSLSVGEGEFLAVQGPSGSGKTTLLLAAGALLAPDGGHVRIGGRDPYAMGPQRRAALRAECIGFVFQQFHLVPYLTVMENVLAASLAVSANADPAGRAKELIGRFGLSRRSRHLPGELSTGERQRVALARALLNRPAILLADEPTGNLDDANAAAVLNCLGEFADAGGAVLLVTHSNSLAQRAGRIVRIETGRLQR